MFPAPGLCHALVNGDLQIHFPALSLFVGAVLSGRHSAFLLLLLLGFHNRETVLHTQLVGCLSQLHETFLIAVVFETSVAAYGVDHEMGMDMISICMCCNHDLKARDLFCQLQGDLVCHLRGDRIVRTEELNHVIVHPSICASILPLSIHKFQQGSLGYTVDPRNQGAALVRNLGRPAAVGDDTMQTTNGLGLLTFRKFHDCHSYHRFRLRMSDSRELTEI